MNIDNFRSIVPGLLPLAVLIFAEMIWGMTTALIAAAILGIVELVWYAFRYKRFEKSVLFDFGILILFGLSALLFEGEKLEQLKSAFMMVLLMFITGVSLFSKHNIFLTSAGRYFKNMRIGPWEMFQMRHTMLILFWSLALYTLVFFICFFLASPAYINFMEENGLFIFFGAFIVAEFIRKRILRKKLSNQEWLPIVDEEGKVLGQVPRSIAHNGKTKWLHPVVHLHIVGTNGIWLQKRPMHKLVQPGKWDTAVGGHLSAGESVEKSLQREAGEEIGVEVNSPVLLGRYIWESSIECEMVFAFMQLHNGIITPNPEELDGGRFWSTKEIDENIGKEIFTPNFEHEYMMYKTEIAQFICSRI